MRAFQWLLGLVVVVSCAFALEGYVVAVEEPAFRLVSKDGPYELRDYPALVVAETVASGDQRQAASQGFRRLAGYIFGGNRSRQKIAMTAPVAQRPVADTAPVGQTPSTEGWVVRFTMPSGSTLATLPQPNDPLVKLRETAPARYAAARFSGLAHSDDVAKQIAWLSTWIAQHHLTPSGPAILAQYNPPWTLWFLRRNEVMIAVDATPPNP